MKYRPPAACPCGCTYDAFRTGLSFAVVRSLMRVSDDDPRRWRQKRRSGVLGFWHELKVQLWYSHLGDCGAI